MLVRECLERIRFATSTLDDLSGKNINTLFNNNNIVHQLMYALDRYAAETLALQGIYTRKLTTNEHVIDAPPLALRSKTYRMAIVFVQGIKYMLDIVNLNPAETAYRYEWRGVPRWLVAWQNKLYVYPTDITNGYSTTLATSISQIDTTIPLIDASGFLQFNGNVQIGDEKIAYQYREGNTLYNCERGNQDTISAPHNIGATINENNMWIFYYKRHFRIPVINNVISRETLDREMEVCDEDMEIITSYTASALLAKIDPKRMKVYDDKFAEQLLMAKARLRRGRKMTNMGGDIRNQFWWESQDPGVYWQ